MEYSIQSCKFSVASVFLLVAVVFLSVALVFLEVDSLDFLDLEEVFSVEVCFLFFKVVTFFGVFRQVFFLKIGKKNSQL